MNIQEDYVSFETAKLLKEKGFDEKLQHYYDSDGILIWCKRGVYFDNKLNAIFIAPTLQMAMKWLREVHNIKVNVFYNNSNYAIEYFETNTQTGVDESVFIGDGYKSYEEAVEVALKYCLENLI